MLSRFHLVSWYSLATVDQLCIAEIFVTYYPTIVELPPFLLCPLCFQVCLMLSHSTVLAKMCIKSNLSFSPIFILKSK